MLNTVNEIAVSDRGKVLDLMNVIIIAINADGRSADMTVACKKRSRC